MKEKIIEFFKKYGLYIVGGLIVLWLISRLRGTSASSTSIPASSTKTSSGGSSSGQDAASLLQYQLGVASLESNERLKTIELNNQLSLAQIQAGLSAAQLTAAQQLQNQQAAYQNAQLQNQTNAQNAALGAYNRQQLLGFLGGLANPIAQTLISIFGNNSSIPVYTPPTFPRSTPPINPGTVRVPASGGGTLPIGGGPSFWDLIKAAPNYSDIFNSTWKNRDLAICDYAFDKEACIQGVLEN